MSREAAKGPRERTAAVRQTAQPTGRAGTAARVFAVRRALAAGQYDLSRGIVAVVEGLVRELHPLPRQRRA